MDTARGGAAGGGDERTTASGPYQEHLPCSFRGMAGDAATHYDFSEYPLDHPLYIDMNRKAIGFFKDELNTVPMQQFVGLRATLSSARVR